jgi:hypothetical protein
MYLALTLVVPFVSIKINLLFNLIKASGLFIAISL